MGILRTMRNQRTHVANNDKTRNDKTWSDKTRRYIFEANHLTHLPFYILLFMSVFPNLNHNLEY